MDEVGLMKGTRIAEIALENGLPSIGFVQSAGANLTQQVVTHTHTHTHTHIHTLNTMTHVSHTLSLPLSSLPPSHSLPLLPSNSRACFIAGAKLFEISRSDPNSASRQCVWCVAVRRPGVLTNPGWRIIPYL